MLDAGRLKIVLVLIPFLLCGNTLAVGQEPSSSGHTWYPEILQEQRVSNPTSLGSSSPLYLPDFSYAGYRWGEEPLPDPTWPEISVVDHGAVANDGEDDTDAIQRALEEAHQMKEPVIVSVPPGRFIVKDVLFLERSNIVLQGAGSGDTELHFPRPLTDMETPGEYADPLGRDFSRFSWRGGVIWTRHPEASKQRELGRLVAGRRGHHTVKAQRPLRLEEGDVVQIRWVNREGENSSLLHHIYCTGDVQFGTNLYEGGAARVATQEVTIEEVSGQTIRLKEPLLHDLRRRWGVTVHTVDYLEEVGIEGFRITFPEDVEYGGHHQEAGYNGIYLTNLQHSWVQDVTVENADSGVLSNHSKNFTIEDISAGGGRWGHYSIHLGSVYGALVTDFELGPTLHNPSFNTKSRASVYSDGFILSPVLDQHMGVNHQNLFDHLRTRYNQPADRLFVTGGSVTRWGPVAGAFNTFWNIRVDIGGATESPVEMRKLGAGAPHGRLIGVHGGNVPIDFEYGPHAYIEGKNEDNIAVTSLYDHQLENRLEGEAVPSLAIYEPLDGDGFAEGEPVTISADLRGDFEPERVRFFGDGEQIGVDREGDDRWSVTWAAPPSGSHSITAVAEDAEENTLSARPLSCNGESVRFWVGEEDDLLLGNFPNPFRQSTTIEYVLPETRHVRLGVFDVLGRRVKTIVDKVQFSGRRREQFNAGDLASGTYLYRLQTGSYSGAGKAVLVR